MTFVAPLPESTVADVLFKFKKVVLNQKLAAVAKAGTWVKKRERPWTVTMVMNGTGVMMPVLVAEIRGELAMKMTTMEAVTARKTVKSGEKMPASVTGLMQAIAASIADLSGCLDANVRCVR